MKLLTSKQMRDADRYTIEKLGIPGIVLMEQAGKGVYKALLDKFSYYQGKKILLFCGKGNNGGDGFVTARYLLNKGFDVKVWLIGKRADVKGDALINLKLYEKIGGYVEEKANPSEIELKNALNHCKVVVDALFGTGLSKPLGKPYISIIKYINASEKPVVSVDISSGIDASSGQILGEAVKSDLTVTFAYPKIGHYVYPGASFKGELLIEDIGIPETALNDSKNIAGLICFEDAKRFCKPRKDDCHKGDNGHLLIIAGSRGKSGAAYLASYGALKSGAGLVTLAVPESLNSVMEAKTTEVMTSPLPEQKDGTISEHAFDKIIELFKGKDAVVIGPGMSVNKGLENLISQLLPVIKVPAVLDADCLNILSKNMDVLNKVKTNIVITPHPGEMARLIRSSSLDIQRNRIKAAQEFSKLFKVTIVLKGAATVIAHKDGSVFINSTGNSGMAAGGMGDVLTGMIGSFTAQGYSVKEAATLGVYTHGAAGDMLAETYSPVGYTAEVLCNKIPLILRKFLS